MVSEKVIPVPIKYNGKYCNRRCPLFDGEWSVCKLSDENLEYDEDIVCVDDDSTARLRCRDCLKATGDADE